MSLEEVPSGQVTADRVQSFRDLKLWQRAIQMTVSVYQLTAHFPREEQFGLTSQMRRAGVLIASKIAEGFGRGSQQEYKHCLGLARGANMELQTHLVIANELKLASSEDLQRTEDLTHEVGKMLFAMLRKL